MTVAQGARRKRRAADALGMFTGIMCGLWVDGDDLWPRLAVAAVVGVAMSLLLRLVLRVPVWRSDREDEAPNVRPCGSPPVG